MKKRINKRLKEKGRHYAQVAVVITMLLCVAAYLGAFFLRFDFGGIENSHVSSMWIGLPLLLFIRMMALAYFQVHRGLYRYVSLHDAMQLLKAVTLSSVFFCGVWLVFLNNHYWMPRSIYLLDWMLCLGFLVGLRVIVRIWRTHHSKEDLTNIQARHALIVGAGNLGESVLRMIDRRFLGQTLNVIGFVDDDHKKIGSSIHGVPVLGDTAEIPHLVQEFGVFTIIFAITNPRPDLYSKVVAGCEGLALRFNTVSVLKNVSSGENSIDRMRGLRIEDLLGRDPVKVDSAVISADLKGRTVLVTGAGGSIGAELCRQISSMTPKCIVLFESGETPLFEIDGELRRSFPDLNIQPFIGDVKHRDVVDRVFTLYKPDYVYHAAAYKHVPLMETHPDEAVLNNVRGTRNLAEAARQYGAKRFVMISTDKAVRPTNVMGATKRLCEWVIQSLNGGDTIFVAVRFGNVLGSNGSVVPLFKKQLENGGPLTVTHPDVTRYFMMIPEAVSLVLQCGVVAEPSDIFVLDMGTPVKILDMARNMIRLSGLREGTDVSIKIIGLRPGEKMHEELIAYGEALTPTTVQKVNVLKQESKGMDRDVLAVVIRHLEALALAREPEKVRILLWRLMALDYEQSLDEAENCTTSSVRELLNECGEDDPLASDNNRSPA